MEVGVAGELTNGESRDDPPIIEHVNASDESFVSWDPNNCRRSRTAAASLPGVVTDTTGGHAHDLNARRF